MEEVKIAIIGSRNFKDMTAVRLKIFEMALSYKIKPTIISGGARGVDTIAIHFAKEMGFPTNYKDYLPDFAAGYDVGEYFARNDRLIDDAYKVIAFWDGKSRGTWYGIERCIKTGKNFEVVFDS